MPEGNRPDQIPVARFNEWLANHRTCDDCPMLNRGTFVGADSATGTMERQKVLFLGLNPGNEEARIGRPFVGPSGKFLRQQLPGAGINSWGMANSLLCSSANEAAICGADQARGCCRGNLRLIFNHFQSPTIVPCGNGAWSIFRARMAITAATEQFFISRGPTGRSQPALILPIFHPSALIRSGGEGSSKYPAFLRRLETIGRLADIAARDGNAAAIAAIGAQGHQVLECFRQA